MTANNKNQNISETVLTGARAKSLAWSLALISVACLAPFFHYQPITGPIINATLFLAALFLSLPAAFSIAIIPSLIAISVGTLPAIAAPLLPAIMVSNMVLIAIFAWLKRKNYFLAMISASLVKFAFLTALGFSIANLIGSTPILKVATNMLSWAQLFTALTGGLLAWGVWKRVLGK